MCFQTTKDGHARDVLIDNRAPTKQDNNELSKTISFQMAKTLILFYRN